MEGAADRADRCRTAAADGHLPALVQGPRFAVKELNLSCHNSETMLLAVYSFYGNLELSSLKAPETS